MPTVTPRVPIQTPMFDESGNLTRTWVIFFERLGLTGDYEKATFVIYDPAVATNVTNLLPARRSGTAVDAEIVPKQDVTSDFTFDILLTRAGEPFDTRESIFGPDKLTAPAGTLAGEVVRTNVFREEKFKIRIDDVLSSDIIASDGTGVYTVVLRWSV
jgi:hypothetical protein